MAATMKPTGTVPVLVAALWTRGLQRDLAECRTRRICKDRTQAQAPWELEGSIPLVLVGSECNPLAWTIPLTQAPVIFSESAPYHVRVESCYAHGGT